MKIIKIISCLLICCFGVVLYGCKDKKENWIHTTQYYRYLQPYDHTIEITVQDVSHGYTNLTNCYNGNFNTVFRHIEFRLYLKNNAPSGWSGMLLHLDSIDFKFNNDLAIYKMYMYLNKYTEDYTCFKIDANNSYIVYLRVLYKDLPNNQSQDLENDYILKLWDIRI